MEFGAVLTYKQIDQRVEATLQEAADILKKIKVEEEAKTSSIHSKSSFSEVSCSSYGTQKSISIGSIRRGSQEPRATIRTPKDAIKTREIFFAPAEIGSKMPSVVSGSYMSSDKSSFDPVTPTPDSMFPEARYIPAHKVREFEMAKQAEEEVKKKANEMKMKKSSSITYSSHLQLVEKLAAEPLEDLKKLKSRRVVKCQPDGMFPKASYIIGEGQQCIVPSPTIVSTTASTESSTVPISDVSSLYQPMEFVSTNGRMKLYLQPLEERKLTKSAAVKAKKTASATSFCTEEEFPIVPKQLQSSTKLKAAPRAKFSAFVKLGELSIDLSGIFNGNVMKKSELSKVVINGDSYSIN